ncbi:hypothetical protein [Streptomyces rochei]|uniref:hypothetical protein n=1 Tax=Streptomyces rochei TaxID=1928 RepID=UPI003D8BFE82
MIQITLGRRRSIDPSEDAFARSQIGWTEGALRPAAPRHRPGNLVMPGERVERERFAVVSGDVIIRQAMEIDRIVDTPDGRRAFEGRILGPGHPVYDRYVGRPAPNGAQQNPITYFKSPLDNRKCNCGCGKPIERGDFLPDTTSGPSTSASPASAPWMDFLTWFDQTWKTEEGHQDDAV